jgi:hypothetical protein
MELMTRTTVGRANGAPGGADSATVSPGTDQGSSGLPGSIKDIVKKRRGTPPGAKRGPYSKGNRASVSTAGPEGSPAAEPSTLFTPENTKLIVRMPFNMAFAKTGFTGWKLTPAEDEALAAPLAVSLNTWLTIDPKWVSLMILGMGLLSIVGEKSLMYAEFKKEQEKNNTVIAPEVINK